MALSPMKANDPFTKADMHRIKRASPLGTSQWPASKYQRLCSPTPPCEESLSSIHTHAISKLVLPTPPDSLSGKDELEAEASPILPIVRVLDPATTLLLTPFHFTPASQLTLAEEMVVLRKRPHVENLGDVHKHRKKIVLELPYARITPKDDDGRDFIGFINPGLWCWRRALTQCLMNLTRFGDYLHNCRALNACGALTPARHPTPCLLEVLADLHEACERRNRVKVNTQISNFDQALRAVSFTHNKAWLRTRAQHDAHELLRILMHDHFFPRFGAPPGVLDGLFSVRRLRGGRCKVCNAESTPTVADEMGLTLMVSPGNSDKPISLEKLIDYDYGEEEVEVNCDTCGVKNGRRARTHMISSAPEILIIHLARFAFSDPYAEEGDKIDREVEIPKALDMSKYLNRPSLRSPDNLLYKLNSTVCHSGQLSSGHYICYANKGGVRYDKVYRFDDQTVKEVPSHNLAKPPKSYGIYNKWTPYILFYECIKSPPQALNVTNANNEHVYRPAVPSMDSVEKMKKAIKMEDKQEEAARQEK